MLPRFLGRLRTVEQTLTLIIQVTQLIGLKPIRQNTEQQMTGQVRRRSPPEYGLPTVSKPREKSEANLSNRAIIPFRCIDSIAAASRSSRLHASRL
jgi:hypothetical protein